MTNILLTTDAMVTIGGKEIVLIKRAKEPFMDKLVMPGGHVDLRDQSVAHACARELEEEVGLKVGVDDLKFLTVLDAPDRDPRTDARRISIVYTIDLPNKSLLENCKAATDAKEIHVVNIDKLKKEDLGFDHWEAVEKWKKENEAQLKKFLFLVR